MAVFHESNPIFGHLVKKSLAVIGISSNDFFVERPFVIRIFRNAPVPVDLFYVDSIISAVCHISLVRMARSFPLPAYPPNCAS
jgi:hypothetical protein